MYVHRPQRTRTRSPGLGSLFTDLRNAAEQSIASYYPSLSPFMANMGSGGSAAPAAQLMQATPAPAPAPVPAPVRAPARGAGGFGVSMPVIIGGVALAGVAAFMFLKRQ